MTDYTTRALTTDEGTRLLDKLLLALGTQARVDAALGVIGELGLGVFVATPVADARTEDLDYADVDLRLPVEEQCGHALGQFGRVCSRRANHVNEHHRSGEVSWTDEMAVRP